MRRYLGFILVSIGAILIILMLLNRGDDFLINEGYHNIINYQRESNQFNINDASNQTHQGSSFKTSVNKLYLNESVIIDNYINDIKQISISDMGNPNYRYLMGSADNLLKAILSSGEALKLLIFKFREYYSESSEQLKIREAIVLLPEEYRRNNFSSIIDSNYINYLVSEFCSINDSILLEIIGTLLFKHSIQMNKDIILNSNQIDSLTIRLNDLINNYDNRVQIYSIQFMKILYIKYQGNTGIYESIKNIIENKNILKGVRKDLLSGILFSEDIQSSAQFKWISNITENKDNIEYWIIERTVSSISSNLISMMQNIKGGEYNDLFNILINLYNWKKATPELHIQIINTIARIDRKEAIEFIINKMNINSIDWEGIHCLNSIIIKLRTITDDKQIKYIYEYIMMAFKQSYSIPRDASQEYELLNIILESTKAFLENQSNESYKNELEKVIKDIEDKLLKIK